MLYNLFLQVTIYLQIFGFLSYCTTHFTIYIHFIVYLQILFRPYPVYLCRHCSVQSGWPSSHLPLTAGKTARTFAAMHKMYIKWINNTATMLHIYKVINLITGIGWATNYIINTSCSSHFFHTLGQQAVWGTVSSSNYICFQSKYVHSIT